MQAFIWQDDLIGVAKLINTCLKKVKPPLSGGSAFDERSVAGRDVISSALIFEKVLEEGLPDFLSTGDCSLHIQERGSQWSG